MNILLLGNGGREHAFAWKIKQSGYCDQLYIAPGNAGTMQEGINLKVDPMDFGEVKQAVIDKEINLVVVGPEAPLVAGICDFFQQDDYLKNIHLVGPSKDAAQLEGSKDFAKHFMQEFGIPTAAYRSFTNATKAEGVEYIAQQKTPIVLKADGLAAGKGVMIINDIEEAQQELSDMLGGKFGQASNTVVIEEYLDGIEFSVFVATDGKSYKILPAAKDYKRIGEGNTGLNTGGMGSVSPVPFLTPELMKKVESKIIQPTIRGIQSRGLDYKGFIFFGLIEVKGEPYVIEYNCRMGDPETQSVLARMDNDFVDLLEAIATGNLRNIRISEDRRFAATVILVSGGYPEKYQKLKEITGLERVKDSLVFHAGTKREWQKIKTNGGRVIALTSYGQTMDEAIQQSNKNAECIKFDGKYYRKDIGFDL
ncbi:MAG: phosphoribosylamine--glycine ligase [Bacteroidota bacterium]